MAEQAMNAGLRSLAEGITEVHNVMLCLQKGDYESVLQYMTEMEGIDLKELAEGTKFQEAAENLAKPLNSIIKTVNEGICLHEDGVTEDTLDINASVEVLSKVKEKHFPKRLSMIEKMDKWQKNDGRER